MQECCRSQARRFLRILKYKKNSNLISHCIQTVKIVVYKPPTNWNTKEVDPIFSLAPRGLLKHMGICKNPINPIKTALTKFENAPIEELMFKGVDCVLGPFPYFWASGTLLLKMCSNPNLKTLHFKNIRISHSGSLGEAAITEALRD